MEKTFLDELLEEVEAKEVTLHLAHVDLVLAEMKNMEKQIQKNFEQAEEEKKIISDWALRKNSKLQDRLDWMAKKLEAFLREQGEDVKTIDLPNGKLLRRKQPDKIEIIDMDKFMLNAEASMLTVLSESVRPDLRKIMAFDEPIIGESQYGKYYLYAVSNGSDKEYSLFAPDAVHEVLKLHGKGTEAIITKLVAQRGKKLVTTFDVQIIGKNGNGKKTSSSLPNSQNKSSDSFLAAMDKSFEEALTIQTKYNGMANVNQIAITLFIQRTSGNGMVFGHVLSKYYGRHTSGIDISNIKDSLEKTYDQIPVIKHRIEILQNLKADKMIKRKVEDSLGKTVMKYVDEQPNPENQWKLYNILTYYVSHIVEQRLRASYQMKVSKMFML